MCSWSSPVRGGLAETPRRATVQPMLYDVLVVSNGEGERRFTLMRETALTDGDEFEHESELYRALGIQPAHGPFDGLIEAEWLGRSVSPPKAP
jgi:hypothetical protein